jgi:hypothetical protein
LPLQGEVTPPEANHPERNGTQRVETDSERDHAQRVAPSMRGVRRVS